MSEPATQTVEVCPRQTGKTSRLLRYLEGRPERWQVDIAAPAKRWAPHALFNSREAAEAYAEALVKRSAQRNLMARVVDRDPSDQFQENPDPKPWEKAQPDEIWVLTIHGCEQPVYVAEFRGEPVFQVPGGETISLSHSAITAGRRIWPETEEEDQ